MPGPESASRTAWCGCYPGFADDVSSLAGSDAVDCGFAKFRTNRASRACLAHAIASNEPFKTGYLSTGEDSFFCDIVVHDSDGRLWTIWYDFDVTGAGTTSRENAVLSVQRCRSIRLEPGTTGSFFLLDDCEADAVARTRLIERIPWAERTSAHCER